LTLCSSPAAARRKSPAALAGLQAGDLIISVGGRRITGASELQQAVSECAGARFAAPLDLGVLRRGTSQLSLRATPVDFEEYTRARQEEEKTRSPSRRLTLIRPRL